MDWLIPGLDILFGFVIYPGLVFSSLVGGLYYWFFRKVRARFQSRRGPPWYQSFADIAKLLSKELIIPEPSHKGLFVISPILYLFSLLIVLLMIPVGIPPPVAFFGDLIVVLYFLMMPSIALALIGSASSSPYGAIGTVREVTMMIGYELPFILSVLAPWVAIKSLSVSVFVEYQVAHGWLLFKSPFYALTGIALFLCLLGKLGVKPFDIPEAKQEIVQGPLTEASGPILGVFEWSKMIRWFTFCVFYVDLFLGGGDGLPLPWNIVSVLAKCLVLTFVFALFEVANARFVISHAFKWLLKWPLALSVIGMAGVLIFS